MSDNWNGAVILIPSLEPDDRLPAYIGRLMDSGLGRVVVVDDGSSPSAQSIFDRIAAMPGCQVLHHDVNHGKGVALKTGYAWIRENLPDCSGVITADADGQHTVADCLHIAEELEKGENALYLGSRDFSLPNVPAKSRKGNRITSAVFKALYGVWLPDTQTGLRGFRREELAFMEAVEGERYEYEMNVLIACARRRLPMVPVTIETVYENNNEGTHFHPVRDSWRIYQVILRGVFRFGFSSLFCVGVDQLAAALLRWLLAGWGIAAGTLANINLSGYIARVISAVVNYQLNKRLVFKAKGRSKASAWKYAILSVGIITLSNAGTWLLGRLGVAAWLAKLICDTVLFFASYRLQQLWVFAEEKEAEA